MEKLNVVIDEKSYQQIKKEMCKISDYFNVEEWKKLKKEYRTKYLKF